MVLSSSREDAELHGFNRANAEKDDKSLGQTGLRRGQRSHDRRADFTYRARGISESSLSRFILLTLNIDWRDEIALLMLRV